MTAFRFIHTADLHLGSPFRGLAHLPKSIYQSIEKSTFEAFEKIIDYCIVENVDFLLIAGDIYDIEKTSVKTQLHFFNSIKKLSEHGILTYIIHGNHDPYDSSKLTFNWPDTVHFFSASSVEQVPFVKNGQEVAKIFGRSYPTKSFKENIVKQYNQLNNQSTKTFTIGLLHTNVDGNAEHDTYAPTTKQELTQSEIDYWALGHIHKGQILSDKNPAIIYPGNPQGRHIKEFGQKSCLLVDVDGQAIKSIKRLPTSRIIWDIMEMDVSSTNTIEEIIEQIQTKIDRLLTTNQNPVIIRVILKGKTNFSTINNKAEVIEDIQTFLNEIYSKQQPWIWVESIELNLSPYVDVDEIIKQNSFIADLLNQLELIKEQDGTNLLNDVASDLFKHRGLKRHLLKLTDTELEQIFLGVRQLTLDYLMEDD